MDNLKNRLEILCEVFDRWLRDENKYMRRAVQQTVDDDYFSFADVQFALKSLRQSLNEKTLRTWINRSGISDKNDAPPANVLCLHAGNVPLVGFQDALAVLLSGARYTGKISRRDPYLLPVFLNEVKKTPLWNDRDVQWSHRLDDFEDMQHDMILFAGSRESVSGVKRAIKNLKLKKEEARYLIRTAHFSMAYVDEPDEQSFKYLIEAILRYGGRGCRSVAVVVSPVALNFVKDDLKKHAQKFWTENPPHQRPKPKLYQRYAYNKAIERSQLWLEDFLMQQGGLELDQDFICYWIQGGEESMHKLKEQFGERLQSIYFTRSENERDFAGVTEAERLSSAQQPPIYWKPDGTDTLQWLIETNESDHGR